MKIGWCRLSQLIQLDFNKSTRGQTEMRTGHMRALVNAGHEIKILSGLDKDSIATLEAVNNDTYGTEADWDVSWLKQVVEYAPEGDASDCDLLLVESAACNWMFQSEHAGIRHCVQILSSFKGKVIVDQSDPDLPFPFGKMGCMKRGWSHKKNPYRLSEEKGHKELVKYGWGDASEIWDDKEYYVVVRSQDIEAVANQTMYNGRRFRYAELVEQGKIKIIGAPQTWDFTEHSKGMEFNDMPQYDFTFAGYPRSPKRERKFAESFMSMSFALDKAVSGPWQKKANEELAVELDYNCIEWVGNLSWRGLVEFLNNTKFSLYLGVDKAYKLNWQTNKPFEAIASGAIILFDNEIQYLNSWFSDAFALTPENKDFWTYTMIRITPDDRKVLWQYQYNKIKHRTWEYFIWLIGNEIGAELTDATFEQEVMGGRSKKVKILFEKLHAEYENRDVEQWEKFLAETSKLSKDTYDEKIRENYGEPECYGKEYGEEDEACAVCPFAVNCIPICAGTAPEGSSDKSEEKPDGTLMTPTPVDTEAPARDNTEEQQNIVIEKDKIGERSMIVITIKKADNLSLTLHL